MLMFIGITLLMVLFIKVCSVHTPSSNPNLPQHRQLPGELVSVICLKANFVCACTRRSNALKFFLKYN